MGRIRAAGGLGLALIALALAVPARAGDRDRSVAAVRAQAPQARPLPLQDTVVMLDEISEAGQRILVIQGTRKAGTRAAVHTHPHAGHTCVIRGSIVPLMEGRRPVAVPAGRCYTMPANVAMAAANLGTGDAVLIDTFILEPGRPEIILLESYP